MPALSILHLHSSFDLGGKEARAVRLMNAFGVRARHTILSGVRGALGARAAIDAGIRADFPDDAPSLTGRPSVARYQTMARYMRRFDLVLSYNWGAMDGVMARRLFPQGVPPLIHHEDGFNEDEAKRLKFDRNIFRRIALPTANALVVPSQTLERIARDIWKQPDWRVQRIPNGIAVKRYAGDRDPRAIPGFTRKKGEVVIGSLAGLRAVKDLPRLVRAVSRLPANVRLVIAGEGPEREAILAAADAAGIADRVHLPGFMDRPWRYVGLFDIVALSSRSEQFPISIVEAMAAGLPVASPDVGDVLSMIADENRALLAGCTLEKTLHALVLDEGLRKRVGAANRARAVGDYDEDVMIARYAHLYGGAVGRSDALTV
jgi:glycosyltransferase involved in cell wall biosynthesis